MRRILITTLGVIFVAGAILLVPFIREPLSQVVKSVQGIPQVKQPVTDEFVPGALEHSNDTSQARLTRSRVVSYTNTERTKEGLKKLTENAQLQLAAERKLKDMFDRQYFEHISPDGNGPGYIIDKAGYKYIVVGENLALGNFKDDEALVAAWMASPGHRANILNNRFSEIGVAVGEGMYNGKKTWLAVQEFGLPASYCPSVNQTLKSTVDAETVRADTLSQQLVTIQKELRAMPRSNATEEEAYRKRVEYYNSLVSNYNKLVAELKADIDEYNHQVRVYNNCIEA
jgi:uncharacterized protein YkwD